MAGGSFIRGYTAAELGAHWSAGMWDHSNTGGVRAVRSLD
jgi:hypothetical protein